MKVARFALPLLIALVATGCSSSETQPVAQQPASPAPSTASSVPPEAKACQSRPAAMGDILLRQSRNGGTMTTTTLGGLWVWNYRDNACQTSADETLENAALTPGYCAQVAQVADNPNYDVDARPSKPLKKLIGTAGPGCK